uniref:(California timema) hypothetical protein n=1 Tax=Timema californicum TaxID=61474 RepID=A0A7R9P6T4_TIMCA|nr:unnamed protein product [Timema californicum]
MIRRLNPGEGKPEWPKVMLAGLGIVGMSFSFPTVYLYSGELFPTVVRNVGVGSASMCARIGSMVAPFVSSLNHFSYYIPPLLFGLSPLAAALLTFLLPETADRDLPDTLEEGENFREKKQIPAEILNTSKGRINNGFTAEDSSL